MNQATLFAEPHDFLMQVEKVNGIALVFEEGVMPSDLLIESVINWAKSSNTLGLYEDPYEVELEESDFGSGLMVSISWAQEIDAISYEVINLVAGFLTHNHPDSGCTEIQVCSKPGQTIVTH